MVYARSNDAGFSFLSAHKKIACNTHRRMKHATYSRNGMLDCHKAKKHKATPSRFKHTMTIFLNWHKGPHFVSTER